MNKISAKNGQNDIFWKKKKKKKKSNFKCLYLQNVNDLDWF